MMGNGEPRGGFPSWQAPDRWYTSAMQVLLAGPRGFCAGVSRAVEIVEQVLEIYGPPIYVKHEIIHNHQVVADLRNRGAVFVETLEEVPTGSPLIFSAHGVPPSDWDIAKQRGLKVIDATCPLVTKVHLEAIRYAKRGFHVLYIGHRGHPEPIGTLGEIGLSQGTLIETLADADAVTLPDTEKIVVLTQTTLSVQDTQVILERLRARFPNLELPPTEDICYATTNRQAAVAELSSEADLVLVVGSTTSSNSKRLVETARAKGRAAYLVQSPEEIDPSWLTGVKTVALSSGASAPEYLVQQTIDRLRELGAQHVEERVIIAEDVVFPLPRTLLQIAIKPKVAAMPVAAESAPGGA
jgi:4-hydroxy-3-methylbut-2-enyl diphosphate reductase